MFFTDKLHSLIFTPVYNNMYPLSEIDDICNKINTGDLTDEEQTYFEKIVDYLNLELRDNIMSEQEEERNLSRLYKTKKKKIEDKEGNKSKEKVKELKRGREEDKIKYSYNIEQRDKKADLIAKVINDIEQQCVDEEDIEVMDIIINSHKLRTGYQIIIFSLILAVITILLIKNIFGF